MTLTGITDYNKSISNYILQTHFASTIHFLLSATMPPGALRTSHVLTTFDLKDLTYSNYLHLKDLTCSNYLSPKRFH